jgi:hypothetical protein
MVSGLSDKPWLDKIDSDIVLDSDIEESEAKEHSARLFINDCTSLLPFDLIHPAATTSKK